MNNNETTKETCSRLNREGELLFERGEISEAVVKFEHAFAINDENPETLNNLGVCFLQLGDTNRALQHFVQGLELSSGHAELVNNACTLLRELGLTEDAENLHTAYRKRRSTETVPQRPSGIESKGQSCNEKSMAASRRSPRDQIRSVPPLGEQPLVTVVIPVHGQALFLRHALRSVFAQDYENWEIIVVGDESADVPTSSEFSGSRRVLHLNRCVPFNAAADRNAAIHAASGEIICYLNPTDLYLPDHLSAVVALMQGTRAVFVYTDARWVTEAVKDGQRTAVFTDLPFQGIEFSRDNLLIQNYIPITSCAHRRVCVDALGAFDQELTAGEDWDLLLRYSAQLEFTHMPRVTVEIHQPVYAAEHESPDPYAEIYRRYAVTDATVQQTRALTLDRLRRQQSLRNAASGQSDSVELYRLWMDKHAWPEPHRRIRAGRSAKKPQSRRKIEVLMVVEDENDAAVARTVASLRGQLYENWRLTVICAFARRRADAPHKRVRSIIHHGDPVGAINRIVERTKSNWVAVLDPGDRLSPHSLMTCAAYMDLHRHWRLIYTDEDEIDVDGKRHNPRFKPDFNLDLLRSVPYLGRFCLIRADTWRDLGGIGAVNGCETYDLTLKVLDQFGEASIGHIADVLYHRDPANTKHFAAAQSHECGRQALAAHFARNQIQASIEPGYVTGSYFVQYLHNQAQPLVSVIVPTRDKLEFLDPCITSLLQKTSYERYEVIIVDNDSENPETLAFLNQIERTDARVRVVRYPYGFNYSAIINWAASQANGEYLLLLNNDTHIVQPNWLERMLSHGLRHDVGIVGARLVYADKRLQHAGVVTGIHDVADHVFLSRPMDEPGYMGRSQCVQNYSAVTAACMLIRKSVFLEVGGMDEEELAVLYNDVDLCLKVGESGYKIVWTPFATLVHHASRSVCELGDEQDKVRRRSEVYTMYDRWLPKLARDPAYNRNLTLHRCDSRPETQVDVTWDTNFHDCPRVLAFPFHQWGSGEYRVRAPMRVLHRAGRIEFALMPLNKELRVPSACELERMQPDVLLLHNALHDQHLQFLSTCKAYSPAFRVFGQDDLMAELPLKNTYRGTAYPDVEQRIRRALSLCDRLVVSTEPLYEALSDVIGDIVVLPNYLERSQWGGLRSRRRRGSRPRIGWAGAQQHAGDLEILFDVVRATHKEADWVFMGMCPEAIRPLCAEYHQGVTIDVYPSKLASLDLDLAVAPLVQNAFNEAKSNLRLLEYGILGWPVICSDILPYRDAPVCRVSNTTDAWINAVRERIHDLDTAAKQGNILRRWVRDRWMLEDHLDEWLHALLPDQSVSHRS